MWLPGHQWPGKATGETKKIKRNKANSSKSTKNQMWLPGHQTIEMYVFSRSKKKGFPRPKWTLNGNSIQYSSPPHTGQVWCNFVQQNRRNKVLNIYTWVPYIYIQTYRHIDIQIDIPPLFPILQLRNLKFQKSNLKTFYIF